MLAGHQLPSWCQFWELLAALHLYGNLKMRARCSQCPNWHHICVGRLNGSQSKKFNCHRFSTRPYDKMHIARSGDIRLSSRQCHLIGLAKLPYKWDDLFWQFSCLKVDYGLAEKNNFVLVKISLLLTDLWHAAECPNFGQFLCFHFMYLASAMLVTFFQNFRFATFATEILKISTNNVHLRNFFSHRDFKWRSIRSQCC